MYQLTTAEQFSRILSDETLSVSREEQALEAALEWVEYDRESRLEQAPQVLGQVQWQLVRNVAALKEALSNPVVAGSPECVAMVEDALRYQAMTYEEKLEYWRDKRKPSRWPK